jgi:hypothetical protein
MASRQEEVPLQLQDNVHDMVLASNVPYHSRHSFADHVRDSFDRTDLDRLSGTLKPQKIKPQLRQREVSNNSEGLSTGLKKEPIDLSPAVRRRSCLTVVNNWWWRELGSVILSVASIAAVTVILAIIHDRPLSSWSFRIAPNGLVSIFATVTKASLMLLVTACISQMRWLYFKHGSH